MDTDINSQIDSSNVSFINKTPIPMPYLKEKDGLLSKICPVCGVEFFKKDFYYRQGRFVRLLTDYMWNNKVTCSQKCTIKKLYLKNKEKINDFQKEYQKNYNWRLRSPNGYKKYRLREYIKRKNNPDIYKEYSSKSYNNMKIRQQSIRDEIYKLYNYSCAICGYSTVLDLHHIDEDNDGRLIKDKSKRLIPLCPNCHICYHRGKFTKEHILKFYKEYSQ